MENINNIDYIETVKETENGYLLNNTLSVPKDEQNKHFQDIQEYINNGGVVLPQYTDIELQEQSKQKRISEILQELSNIDLKSIRPIRESNQDLITQYENEADLLRTELRELV